MNMNKLRSLIFAVFLALPLASFAQEFSVGWAPPPLPVVEQPACPAPGYLWTPGYWGWNSDYYDYYWVPGVWVAPPRIGLLWTPPWWGWNNGVYAFNQGYWGSHVGFYGGVNYGYGYNGNGYWGGRWNGNNFQYNTAVTRVNKTVINNTYVNNNFAKNVNASRTSFNGGNGGIKAQPNAEQRAAMANAKKEGPTSQQLARQQEAAKDKSFLASTNKGKPNQEAIKSFNKTEGAGQGRGGQEVGAAGGAGAGNKLGNERQGQGAGAGGEEHGKKGGAENRTGNVADHQSQGTGMGGQEHGKKGGAQGNQAGTRNKGNAGHSQNSMNQQMHRQQQMNAQHHQQQMGMGGGQHQQKQKMGGQGHPQMQGGGGNRPKPSGQQQQGKKKGNHDH